MVEGNFGKALRDEISEQALPEVRWQVEASGNYALVSFTGGATYEVVETPFGVRVDVSTLWIHRGVEQAVRHVLRKEGWASRKGSGVPFGETIRDPERIETLVKLIQAVWELEPQQRLGQLLSNVAGYAYMAEFRIIEDTKWRSLLEEVVQQGGMGR